ncbi:hypothetical protein L0663_18640 [Dyadobacter sp. CY107]|uniref:hypothetical protein n=1 Tax=Dyadobacter fanqingshengii TaxID=2906443 RepID=UPI001F2AD38B|nr:hypothetical protein [Dyadobacter fanqingshengii]MCF2505417.1 hypothetical protein [Dyadobacter fanqingshengii]
MRESKNLMSGLIICLAICLTSCEGTIYESAKSYDLEVTNAARDTTFVINNRKRPAFIRFSFEGELSHSSAVHWSTDPRFDPKTEILLPAGKPSIPETQDDYFSEKVYVKYKALNDSTSGKLRITVRI